MSSEKFAENRKFFDDNRESHLEQTFKKFLEQYGPEITKGYFMAFHDLLPEIEDIHGMPNNVEKRKMAWALLVTMRGLLQLHSGSDLNSNANMQAPKL